MPRRRRYFETGVVYEICFRARETLPLGSQEFFRFAIQCVLARVLRDSKVKLCHDIWNGSHSHLITVANDSKQFAKFYAEVQKQLTELLKRFLGVSHLRLWEGRPTVMKLGDADAVQDRIAYLYSNPSKDHLVDSIEQFPGCSSWEDFQRSPMTVDAKVIQTYPRLRLSKVPRLPSRYLTIRQDRRIKKQLSESADEFHTLERSPNCWMKCFGIVADEDVQRINTAIVNQLRDREFKAREERRHQKRSCFGARNLRAQQVLKSHSPKKRERKIFIISHSREIRQTFIDTFDRFCALCRDCFERWKRGEIGVAWPPEAFKPPLPPLANVVAF